jgi:hypothetical protein
MRRTRRAALPSAGGVLALLLVGCSVPELGPPSGAAASASAGTGVSAAASSSATLPPGAPDTASYTPAPADSCRAGDGGDLPDPRCTPGATDPRVTQADLRTTICTEGYTERVRPAVSVTEPIKRERMDAYGITLSLSQTELDHLIPLELGGASTVQNLWPEPWDGARGAHVKDTLENALNHLVCDERLELRAAQQAIAGDWETAYRRYVGELPAG